MKKMFLAVAATVLATAAFSQVKYGVQVIGNAGTAGIKVGEISKPNTDMQVGMGAGFVADFPVSNYFSVRTSLNWLQKKSGFSYETAELPGKTFEINTTLNQVELPVHAVYKIPMNNATAFVGVGPSFGYGFSGKLKAKGWIEEDGESEEIIPVSAELDAYKKDADDGADFRRFEISAAAIAGVSFNSGLFVHAGYLHGFTNLIKEEDTYRNRGIQLTVGFLLGK